MNNRYSIGESQNNYAEGNNPEIQTKRLHAVLIFLYEILEDAKLLGGVGRKGHNETFLV